VLLADRSWPDRPELVRPFAAAYGDGHGGWDDTVGCVEGSLTRIVEAASTGRERQDASRVSVRHRVRYPTDELAVFAQGGLHPDTVGIKVCLGPGELLVSTAKRSRTDAMEPANPANSTRVLRTPRAPA
jgi:hypothetical protein